MKIKKIIGKFQEKFNKNPVKSLLVCYGVAITATLLLQTCTAIFGAALYFGGKMPQKQLTADDFTQVGIERVNEMQIINASDDPQLIYDKSYLSNLYINCKFSYAPGEFIAFYSNKVPGNFSAKHMVYAKQYGDYYVFEFPIGTKSVRMDTGVYPSITIDFKEILLNKWGFNEIFRFTTGELFCLAVIPGAIFSLIAICLNWLNLAVGYQSSRNK